MSHQGNEELNERQYEEAQEEAHQHFIIKEFCEVVLSIGSHSVVGQMEAEAREDMAYALRGYFSQSKGEI
jgi:hypothetical protein